MESKETDPYVLPNVAPIDEITMPDLCNNMEYFEENACTQRKFECGICQKEYTRQHDLNSHVRTHTGEKPFVCVICKECFSQKWKLDQHVRIHTGERPFVCDFCQKAFRMYYQLQSHKKRKICQKKIQLECKNEE